MKKNKLFNFKGVSMVNGRFAFQTDIGKVRMTNEDQASAVINSYGTVLLMVADGMGGQNKGELASNLAISTLVDYFQSVRKFYSAGHIQIWLSKTIRKINSYINAEASKNPLYHGMGTTLSVALIHKHKLVTAEIGDSRIYQLKDNKLFQLTDDQTYVGYLYRTGQISKEEMATHPKRHILMNALGVYPSVNFDIKIFDYNGESLLLCSDGLYNNVSESTIGSVLKGDDTPEQKINELIRMGNNNGGSDNIAVVIWEKI